ncbi:serine hydrolase [Tautonia plasticadhaerens]|nr:serine hydrolase [Tautonia plasticadhaerens]
MMTPSQRLLAVTVSFAIGLPCPARGEAPYPGADWPRADPAELGMDEALLARVRDYALTGEGSGMVVRSGRVVTAWGDQDRRYDLKSTTKSFGAAALGLAITEGVRSLDDLAVDLVPEFGVSPQANRGSGWLGEITLRHLASQTAGFAKPGGFEPLLFRPGTAWHYSDGGPNWLADALTLSYRRDLGELMFERLFSPIGIGPDDLTWRANSYRPKQLEGIPRREFGSGISADIDAMARFGYLHLRQGRWKDRQILPSEFVDAVRTPVEGVVGLPEFGDGEHGNASDHYGLLWWNNADGMIPEVPRDAYWSWGLYDSLIVVIPSLDVVAARAGKSWEREDGAAHYDVLRPFLRPLAASVQTAPPRADAPYPPSERIVGVDWAPAREIVRLAPGSDNWPTTWADDDALYTAYGDGRGFRPFVPEKLSLGLARVEGPPDAPVGDNLRSPSLERTGDGPRGAKASGILMVDGVLYLLARNLDDAQVARSTDRGASWTWADWRFTDGFGCPTFLNFGRDYAGARDEFIYVYSPDAETAYEPADRLVLARVPRDAVFERDAYEFFSWLDGEGSPTWSRAPADRAAAFENPGRVYRSTVSFNPAIGRYLLCQTLPDEDTDAIRFSGGFGIYEAPEPWGPWRTVFYTERWDVGPGETQVLPTKWMGDDGQTAHLVFSGDDAFSVRRARFILRD